MGRDYLPYTYHRAIDVPCTKALVSEAQGDVIGYAAGHTIDGGQTLVLSSGRVKSSYRGQGHTKRMIQNIRSHFLSQSGNLKQEVLVTKGENLMHTKAAFHEEYVDILQKALVNFIIPRTKKLGQQTTPDIRQTQGGKKNGAISQLDADEAKSMLNKILSDSFASRKELFSSADFLITNWNPFCVSPKNSEDILQSNDIVLLSGANRRSPETLHCYKNEARNKNNNHRDRFEADSYHYTNFTSKKTIEHAVNLEQKRYFGLNCATSSQPKKDSFEIKSIPRVNRDHSAGGMIGTSVSTSPVLSFGNYFPCKLGLAYNIDLYISDRSCSDLRVNKSELESVGRHMNLHLTHALSQDFERAIHLIVFVSAANDYQTSLVCDVMEKWFGLVPEEWETKHLHLYRRSICQREIKGLVSQRLG